MIVRLMFPCLNDKKQNEIFWITKEPEKNHYFEKLENDVHQVLFSNLAQLTAISMTL